MKKAEDKPTLYINLYTTGYGYYKYASFEAAQHAAITCELAADYIKTIKFVGE